MILFALGLGTMCVLLQQVLQGPGCPWGQAERPGAGWPLATLGPHVVTALG